MSALIFVYLPEIDLFLYNYEFEETNDDIEGGLDGYGGQGLDDEDDDDISDDTDQDWESEYDDDNDEDMQAMTGGEYDRDVKTTNPFAPAEMYLSDMIGKKINDDDNFGEFLVINVSNYLVYNPPSADPLCNIDLQNAVIDLLSGLKNSNDAGEMIELNGISKEKNWNSWLSTEYDSNKYIFNLLN